jgi:hypothetical protein
VIAEILPVGPPKVALVHHHPGRLRLRGPALVQSERVASRARDALQGLSGVARVVHNATSGSLLVEYAPEAIDADAIMSRMFEVGIRIEDNPRPDAARAVVGAARELNAKVAGATGGLADLHGIVSFVLGLGALASLVAGHGPRLPRWDNLLYWSYTFFREVKANDADPPPWRPAR